MHDVIQELHERCEGCVTAGLWRCEANSLTKVAEYFELDPTPETYEEITRDEAIVTVQLLLHRSLAYNVIAMDMVESRQLAERFISECDAQSKFYSNVGSQFAQRVQSGGDDFGNYWHRPATESTFDAGVIAVGATQHACFWVEDED